jgi:hypothetical protein
MVYEILDQGEGGARGQRTARRFGRLGNLRCCRQVLECGSPLPLWEAAAESESIQIAGGGRQLRKQRWSARTLGRRSLGGEEAKSAEECGADDGGLLASGCGNGHRLPPIYYRQTGKEVKDLG